MAYEKSKGMLSVATSYSSGTDTYYYEKIDKYLEASSLNITPDQMQDLDSYVNANGILKRATMPYSRSKIEANIKYCNGNTMDEMMNILKKGTSVKDGISSENKVRIRFYNPKKMEYSYAWAYFPDITYNVYTTSNGFAVYTATRIAFITYGEKANT